MYEVSGIRYTWSVHASLLIRHLFNRCSTSCTGHIMIKCIWCTLTLVLQEDLEDINRQIRISNPDEVRVRDLTEATFPRPLVVLVDYSQLRLDACIPIIDDIAQIVTFGQKVSLIWTCMYRYIVFVFVHTCISLYLMYPCIRIQCIVSLRHALYHKLVHIQNILMRFLVCLCAYLSCIVHSMCDKHCWFVKLSTVQEQQECIYRNARLAEGVVTYVWEH